MGFGSIIATALSIIFLVTAGYVIISGMMHVNDATALSLKNSDDLKNRQLKTALSIDSATGSTAGSVSFMLHNTGSEKIVSLTQTDVILKINDPGNGTVAAYWVPPRAAGQTTGMYWESTNITSLAGDSINPGMLDPGESATITITSDTMFATNSGTILVTSPGGVTTSANVILV